MFLRFLRHDHVHDNGHGRGVIFLVLMYLILIFVIVGVVFVGSIIIVSVVNIDIIFLSQYSLLF